MTELSAPLRLIGRRALITGGGSGIGRASALRLASEGAAVAVVDVRAGASEPVVEAIVGAGGRAAALVADVGDERSIATAVEEAAAALGGLDTVVTCAGITATTLTDTMSIDDWDRVIRVNLTGVFLTVKPALAHLMAAGGGTIVTIGSVASLVAAGRTSAYDASKGGVLQFTRAIAAEFATRGIRANCLCPGVVATDLAANSSALSDRDPVEGREGPPPTKIQVPMARVAAASEMASVVAFLCSDDSSFVTGAAIAADGGYTAI